MSASEPAAALPASPKRAICEFEFHEYVGSLKSASDRTRRIIYVLVTTTILITVTTWNLRPESWQAAHIARWMSEPDEKTAAPAIARRIAFRDQYAKTFVERMVVVHIPALGISLDANDLGIFGGTALTLLMILLWLSLSREYENLCLSLFKVGEIWRHEQKGDVRDSEANLLYHALAMGQVMNHPPTLARWHRPLAFVNRSAIAALFLAPMITQWKVFRGNINALVEVEEKTRELGFDLSKALLLPLQFGLTITLAILAVICLTYVHAADRRWRRTFFRINPDHAHRPQEPLHRWLKLPWPTHLLVRLLLAIDLFFSRLHKPGDDSIITVTRDIKAPTPSVRHRAGMCQALFGAALAEAVRSCHPDGLRYVPLRSVRVVTSNVHDQRWTVAAAVRCQKHGYTPAA